MLQIGNHFRLTFRYVKNSFRRLGNGRWLKLGTRIIAQSGVQINFKRLVAYLMIETLEKRHVTLHLPD